MTTTNDKATDIRELRLDEVDTIAGAHNWKIWGISIPHFHRHGDHWDYQRGNTVTHLPSISGGPGRPPQRPKGPN